MGGRCSVLGPLRGFLASGAVAEEQPTPNAAASRATTPSLLHLVEDAGGNPCISLSCKVRNTQSSGSAGAGRGVWAGGDEALAAGVHGGAEALERPGAQQIRVAWLGEDGLILPG
jgi:hypothetical protein